MISQRKYGKPPEIYVKPEQIKLHRVNESNGNYHNTIEIVSEESELEDKVKE